MFGGEYSMDSAILNNDVAGVQRLLSRPRLGEVLVDLARRVGLCGPEMSGHLHLAALSNSTDVARLLIDSGERVDSIDAVGDTPMHVAARYNAWETVDLLISRGGDIDAVNNAGHTPLAVATACGNHRVAELLTLAAGLKRAGAQNRRD